MVTTEGWVLLTTSGWRLNSLCNSLHGLHKKQLPTSLVNNVEPESLPSLTSEVTDILKI